MAKLIYETTLLVCSSCVIFTGTVSAVLLMLIWPNDRILGLSTRMVIGLCVIIVAIFSVGFVGTIAESTNALIIYACLLILFPVSVLLVEIILRLSSLSPPPHPNSGANSTNTPNTANITQQPHTIVSNNNDNDNNNIASIYSNSFTSNILNNLNNFTKNSISSASNDPMSPFNALITPSSSSPLSFILNNNQNRSNQILLLDDDTKIMNTKSNQSPKLLATIFYRTPSIHSKDDSGGGDGVEPSSSAKHMSSNNDNDPYGTGSRIPSNNNDLILGNNMDRKILHKSSNPSSSSTRNNDGKLSSKGNFFSKIFTASLNPSVETSIEYILIGMLVFVLVQIVISYLLAYKIRTLRSQLKILSRTQQLNQNNSNNSDEEAQEEGKVLPTTTLEEEITEVANLNVAETSLYPDSVCLSEQISIGSNPIGTTNIKTTAFADIDARSFNVFNSCKDIYNCYYHHHHHHNQQPTTSTTSDSENSVCGVHNHHNLDTLPLVQVHCNPDESTAKLDTTNSISVHVCGEHNHGDQILTTNTNTNSSSMDTEDTAISSPLSSSLRTSTSNNTNNSNNNKTNRKNRSGSFRVTFDSLPEFFESNNNNSSLMVLQSDDFETQPSTNHNHHLTISTSAMHQHGYYEQHHQ